MSADNNIGESDSGYSKQAPLWGWLGSAPSRGSKPPLAAEPNRRGATSSQPPPVRPTVVAGCLIAFVGAIVLLVVFFSNLENGPKKDDVIRIAPLSAAQGWLLIAAVWCIAVVLTYDVLKRHARTLPMALQLVLVLAGFLTLIFFVLGLARWIGG